MKIKNIFLGGIAPDNELARLLLDNAVLRVLLNAESGEPEAQLYTKREAEWITLSASDARILSRALGIKAETFFREKTNLLGDK